jgi:hypothetical protein
VKKIQVRQKRKKAMPVIEKKKNIELLPLCRMYRKVKL